MVAADGGVMRMTDTKTPVRLNRLRQAKIMEGLIGLFGHIYIADPENPSVKMIQFQFQIIRKMEGERYVVQYFSFLDGGPTCVGVYPQAELLGPNSKLYVNIELWNEAYEKDCHRY